MNDNDPKAKDKDEDEVRAAHGYRNEVSWDGGRGRQPYANQGAEEQGPDTAAEVEGGDAGDSAGRNIEEIEEVKQKPGRTESEVPRRAGD